VGAGLGERIRVASQRSVTCNCPSRHENRYANLRS
jgi:hypothetical protein